MNENPQQRTTGLVCEEIADEIVVFDKERNVAHCLVGDLRAVWQLADGALDVGALAARLSMETSRVESALARLDDLGLLECSAKTEDAVSRRSALGRFAKAAAVTAAPLAFSLAIPEASSAASGPVQCAFVGCGSTDTYSTSAAATAAANDRCQTQAAKMAGCKGNSTCGGPVGMVVGSNPTAYRVLLGACVY